MTPGRGPERPAIRTPDQRLRVFVSSTLREVEPERRAARTAIEHLQLATTSDGSCWRPAGREKPGGCSTAACWSPSGSTMTRALPTPSSVCAIAALDGDVDRAGVLAGAAASIRHRVGMYDVPEFVFHERHL